MAITSVPKNSTRLCAPLVRAALEYADAGIAVFPCAPGQKTPLTRHGFHDASTNLGQVERWWRRMPDANIALATGTGIDVLDIDVTAVGADRHESGFVALENLRKLGLIDGWQQVVRSPSGGLHLYFPSDPRIPRASWSRGKSHIDFRGTGGYIIAPPSQISTPTGPRTYRVIAQKGSGKPVNSDSIRDLLTPKRPPRPAGSPALHSGGSAQPARIADWVARLPEGSRNSGLFWAACRLGEAQLTLDETAAILTPAATAIGLEDREIDAVLRSAHRTTHLSPATLTDETGAASQSGSRLWLR